MPIILRNSTKRKNLLKNIYLRPSTYSLSSLNYEKVIKILYKNKFKKDYFKKIKYKFSLSQNEK